MFGDELIVTEPSRSVLNLKMDIEFPCMWRARKNEASEIQDLHQRACVLIQHRALGG